MKKQVLGKGGGGVRDARRRGYDDKLLARWETRNQWDCPRSDGTADQERQ